MSRIELCEKLVKRLWSNYLIENPQMQLIQQALIKRGLPDLYLDHFAMIDLPGPHTGISVLKKIFCSLEYEVRGADYLASKQNDFCWLAVKDATSYLPQHTLPQVVIADFRLEMLPPEIKAIIKKYSYQASPFDFDNFTQYLNDEQHHSALLDYLLQYFQRDWPLPTVKEFHTVKAFNELLSWVLIFGRKPNHFTLAAHLFNTFGDLAIFNQFIKELGLFLNTEGGIIKGNKKAGLAQSSTVGTPRAIRLADGEITLPLDFVEFVWRFPKVESPKFWGDYFTDFIAESADHVIESLYVKDSFYA
jgi:hypothetical protein